MKKKISTFSAAKTVHLAFSAAEAEQFRESLI